MPPKIYCYWGDLLSEKAPDTNTLTIKTEAVERGIVFRTSIVNIVDETTTNKLLEVGIERFGTLYPVVKRKAGTNNYSLAPNVKGLVLRDREILYGKVYSPTAGDVCTLVFCGELYKRE